MALYKSTLTYLLTYTCPLLLSAICNQKKSTARNITVGKRQKSFMELLQGGSVTV